MATKSSSPMKFISSIFGRMKNKIANARAEIRVKKMLATSGLIRMGDRMMTMDGKNFETVEQVTAKSPSYKDNIIQSMEDF
eukprot:1362098-Amorphochlora_amoeboformis.AAC.1